MTLDPCVVVVVSGGVVQAIHTDLPISVVLVDYDNIGDGDEGGVYPLSALAEMSEDTAGHLERVRQAQEEPFVACHWKEAKRLFDQITGASYYGQHFRSILNMDADAYVGAVLLERALLRHNAMGMEVKDESAVRC